MTGLPRLMVAPNGARRGRRDHPAIPITIAQIVTDARACFAAGAGGIHAHVRGSAGEHTLDAGLYRELMQELAVVVPNMLVQITTEAVGRYSPEAQMALVQELVPAHVSIAMREISAGQGGRTLARFFAWATEAGVSIQHILYTPDEVRRFETLVARGVVPTYGLELLFVLGQYGSDRDSQPQDLVAYREECQGAIAQAGWAVCAFGKQETACLRAAVEHGGKARIGFENNLFNADGRLATSNAERVRELVSALSAEAAS